MHFFNIISQNIKYYYKHFKTKYDHISSPGVCVWLKNLIGFSCFILYKLCRRRENELSLCKSFFFQLDTKYQYFYTENFSLHNINISAIKKCKNRFRTIGYHEYSGNHPLWYNTILIYLPVIPKSIYMNTINYIFKE